MPISVGTHYCVEFFKNNSGPFKKIGVPLLCKVFWGYFFIFPIFHFSRFLKYVFLVLFQFVFVFIFSFFINNIDPK